MKAAVFLDRDNTIIHNDGDLGDPEQVVLVQGAATAIASLKGLGYRVVVVTNQGGVARGRFGEKDVMAVHDRVCQMLHEAANGARIDAFYYCPYHPQGRLKQYKKEHPNRKPQPGMLLEAAEDLNLDLGQSWMVGDQMRDVQAGAAAGTRTVLIRPDADRLSPLDVANLPGVEEEPGGDPPPRPDFMATNIVEAVRIIAQQRTPEAARAAEQQPPVVKKWDAAAVARLQRAKPKRPADQKPDPDKDAPGPSPKPKGAKGKPAPPFRPWNAPEPRRRRDEDAAAPAEAPTAEPSAPAPTPTPTPTETDPPPKPADRPPPPPPPRTIQSPGIEKSLRLILQELRAQRGGETDLSYLKTFALVLQMVAAVCLIGGLWMGAGDTDLFLRWTVSGLMVQLGAIMCLLYARSP